MSAPIATPTKKPRSHFPDWRLPYGLTKATDSQLEKASESCELWGGLCGGLVFLGVAAELVLAMCHPAYDSWAETWGSALANALVLLGVAGEIGFARRGHRCDKELTRRSNERAAEAELRLEELRKKASPRAVLLNPLMKALEGKAPPTIPIEILYARDDEESWLLANQISFVLRDRAKWPTGIPMPIPAIGHPLVPSTVWVHGQMSGVAVVENPPSTADQSTLGGALRVGLLPSFGRISWARADDMPLGAIRIVVAPKPP